MTLTKTEIRKFQLIISDTTLNFYTLAVSDVFIGRHFREIQSFKGTHPLHPPIEAFANHLPRINQFWEIQLLGNHSATPAIFNLINIHGPMKFPIGELNRWFTLFRACLEEARQKYNEPHFLNLWEEKLQFFERVFKEKLF